MPQYTLTVEISLPDDVNGESTITATVATNDQIQSRREALDVVGTLCGAAFDAIANANWTDELEAGLKSLLEMKEIIKHSRAIKDLNDSLTNIDISTEEGKILAARAILAGFGAPVSLIDTAIARYKASHAESEQSDDSETPFTTPDEFVDFIKGMNLDD